MISLDNNSYYRDEMFPDRLYESFGALIDGTVLRIAGRYATVTAISVTPFPDFQGLRWNVDMDILSNTGKVFPIRFWATCQSRDNDM